MACMVTLNSASDPVYGFGNAAAPVTTAAIPRTMAATIERFIWPPLRSSARWRARGPQAAATPDETLLSTSWISPVLRSPGAVTACAYRLTVSVETPRRRGGGRYLQISLERAIQG